MKKEYIVYKLSECAKHACRIDNELFTKFNVKRGLRNEDGTGVLVGLTKIGNVVGYERTDEGLKPIPGKLFYRGTAGCRTAQFVQGADKRQHAVGQEDHDEYHRPGRTEHHEHSGPERA